MHQTFTNVHFPLATLIKLYKLLKNSHQLQKKSVYVDQVILINTKTSSSFKTQSSFSVD